MRIAVFLGPTLSRTVAAQFLPEAWFLEPCRCGDVLQLLRLRPDRILLIDGYFGWTAAPWHKELLVAMECGVELYGASSMGALRAAELDSFGMRGVGRIYNDFSNHVLDGDDEVAVAHLGEDTDFKSVSDALVDIRYTLAEAVSRGVITPATAEDLLNASIGEHFVDRNLRAIINGYSESYGVDVHSLMSWLDQDNFVSQKRLDALEALDRVRSDPGRDPTPPWRTYRTRYILDLFRWTACAPYRRRYDWLPQIETELIELKESNPRLTEAVRSLAETLIHAADVSRTPELWPSQPDNYGIASDLAATSALSDPEFAVIQKWVFAQASAAGLDQSVVAIMARILERVIFPPDLVLPESGDGSFLHGSGGDLLLKTALRYHALIVLCLGALARTRGFSVRQAIFDSELTKFRIACGLETREAMQSYLLQLELTSPEFALLFLDYLNYRSVFCADRSDALLERNVSPYQSSLSDAWRLVKLVAHEGDGDAPH